MLEIIDLHAKIADTETEIIKGLKPGDQVILTDMSAWDAYDRVRVN